MSEHDGRALGEALLHHPDHELYDGAMPGELQSLAAYLKVALPPSLRGLLSVGSGGVLASGDLLLGTKDPDQLGATMHEVARALWDEGLPRRYLPLVDGERFFCLDLERLDDAGEPEVVEIAPDDFRELERFGRLADFARRTWLA